MNVDRLNIETMPVSVSRRKIKAGMQGLKKEERKKLNVLLWCFGGGGIVIGVIVIISAIVSGQFSAGTKPEKPRPAVAQSAAATAAEKTEKVGADEEPG